MIIVIITAAVADYYYDDDGTTQVQTISTFNYREYFLRSLLFLDVTQHRLVEKCFGTTYGSHLQWSSSPKRISSWTA
jgi:hypothetical protein